MCVYVCMNMRVFNRLCLTLSNQSPALVNREALEIGGRLLYINFSKRGREKERERERLVSHNLLEQPAHHHPWSARAAQASTKSTNIHPPDYTCQH